MRLAAAALLLALSGCGGTSDPAGGSPDEDRALNDAAAMLDANSVAADSVTNHSESRP